MATINVSLDNPYGDVTIPRAKLHHDDSTVIANPAVVSVNNGQNPYGSGNNNNNSGPVVKDVEPDSARCRACCYRCRKK